MQSLLHHPTAHDQEPEPQTVVHHHGEEEDHEKKSKKVLKKVKEKAKKIKDTLTKHGHGHGEHVPDDHDLDEENDDEDEEGEGMEQDPEFHGAPIYESGAMSGITGQPGGLSHPLKAGRPVLEQEEVPLDRTQRVSDPMLGGPSGNENKERFHAPQNTPMSFPSVINQTGDRAQPDQTRTFVALRQGSPGHPKANLELPEGLEEDPASPKGGGFLASNYQTKVADPIGKGGEEASVGPIIQSLGELKVTDDANINAKPEEEEGSLRRTDGGFVDFPTGSHDKFFSEPAAGKPSTVSAEASRQPSGKSTEETEKSNQPGYTEKISSATSALMEKAASAKNAVVAKLGYGDAKAPEGEGTAGSAMEYGRKIAAPVIENVTPLYEKVKGASGTAMTKLPSATRDEHQVAAGETSDIPSGQDRGVSVRDYLAGKLTPGEEDRALSEVIAERLGRGKHEERPRGKVTESREVAERLGPFGGGEIRGEKERG